MLLTAPMEQTSTLFPPSKAVDVTSDGSIIRKKINATASLLESGSQGFRSLRMDFIRRNNRLGRSAAVNALRLFRVLAASILDRLCMPSGKCEMQLNASRISANAARTKFRALASSRLIDIHANNYFPVNPV
jgi:hypothetical protein